MLLSESPLNNVLGYKSIRLIVVITIVVLKQKTKHLKVSRL